MANLAVFASGNGSNFEAIARALTGTRHALRCLVCDRQHAYALERAARLGIPAHFVSYRGKPREEAEREIVRLLEPLEIDLVALAGFMRVLTPLLVDRFRIVNIHPALFPKYPGTHAIERSYEAGDRRLGITIHWIDHGVDTGPVIRQVAFERPPLATLEEIENTIHNLEHRHYPEVVIDLLDRGAPAEGRRAD